MKVLFLTNEYPPYSYGGAGVHVEYLTRELSSQINVEVRCFGDQAKDLPPLQVKGFNVNEEAYKNSPSNLKSVFTTLERCLGFAGAGIDADLVHCHTWYTHMGGIWAKLNYKIPLVITTHSLEPLRPWKREQLGAGYDFSCWVEKTALEMADAVIAVSKGTKIDILKHFKVQPDKVKIIPNGIDTEEYRKVNSSDCFSKFGVNPNIPYVLFVGRITRQKGIIHFVNAIPHLQPNIQVVLAAGQPDTPEIAKEMKACVDNVRATRENVVWLPEMVDKKSIIELYSNASVFCCPSIYEPFGIINLEAMACETPVVASSVGGIPEVVVNNETGFLVELQQQKEPPFEPVDPKKFSEDLAEKINTLLSKNELRQGMAIKGRKRVENLFSWKSVAKQTIELYNTLKK
ncbi:glycogen synthase [bacterium]|nr:glycogen synthase [bacterium]